LSVEPSTVAFMADDLPTEVRELAAFQGGILSRGQLLNAGLSGALVTSRLRRGSWRRIYPGVYSTSSGELSRTAILWAAVLYAGPRAALSHHSAAEVWRLTDEPGQSVHVAVPGDRRVTSKPGIVLHLSARATETVHPSLMPPRTRVEETVIDLWDTSRNLDTAVGWVTRAIGRRRTTADKLGAAVARRSRVRWRSTLTELLDMDGVHSVLEYRYVRDVERRHRLPSATRQQKTRDSGRSQYRDEVYEEYQTVVELDGRAAHPGDTRWEDIRRDNAAAAAGLVTLRYGWQQVTMTPCQVAAEIAEVLALRGYGGARPCDAACSAGHRNSAPGPARARAARVLERLSADLRQDSAAPETGYSAST
jgi:very-short-patch-repair endonuclease